MADQLIPGLGIYNALAAFQADAQARRDKTAQRAEALRRQSLLEQQQAEAAQRAQAQEDRAAQTFAGQQADRTASYLTPGQPIDPASASILRTGGRGGLIGQAPVRVEGIQQMTGGIGAAATPAQRTTYLGTPPQLQAQQTRESAQAAQQRLDEHVRTLPPALQQQIQMARDLGATPADILKIVQPKPADTTPVMRVNPRTGQVEQIGSAPKDAHFVTQPAEGGASDALGVETDARTSPNGTKYLDLSMYNGKERTQARAEAHAKGIVALGKEDAAALGEAQNALDNLDYVDQQISSKLPKDASGRVLSGAAANTLSQFFQSDQILAAAGSLRATAINSLRAAAGSKGFRMTEAEINLAVENDIPKVTDTIGTAQQKLNNMRQMIRNAERSHLGQNTRPNTTLGAGTAAGAPGSSGAPGSTETPAARAARLRKAAGL